MMNFSGIDFASRRPLPRGALPVLALLLVLGAWGLYRAWQADRTLTAARQQWVVVQAQQARQNMPPPAPSPALPKEEVRRVNEAIAALNLPWPALLGAIETARPREVVLTRIEPRAKDQLVLVTAQADDMAALVLYMQQLARSAPFVRTQPVRQERVAQGNGERLQATFEAQWDAQREMRP